MKKALIFLHKWLGVGLALLFAMWFASGIVMYYVPFPSLTQGERLAGMQPLRTQGPCCLTAQDASARAGVRFSEARLGMFDDQPVWRLLGADKRWVGVDAASGAALAPLTDAEAAVAQRCSGRRALHVKRLERDQWTVAQGYNPHRPLVRVEMEGTDGLAV